MSARNKKRKNRARISRAAGAKLRRGGKFRPKRSASSRRSRPAGRSGRDAIRAGAAREKKLRLAKQAREKKLKLAKLARLKRDKAQKLARLKREKTQKLGRLKREKAQKLARQKRDKAQKLARLKRERETALRVRKRKLEQALRIRLGKERERERLRSQREQAILKKQQARERAEEAQKKKREQAKAEKERARQKAQQEAERAREKRAAEQRKTAERHAREAERKRLIAEREAAKEAARRAKEEERSRREAEREAYRKAKEAERERLRAERETARRVREGKVARATKAAQRIDGLRVGTTRVYDPSSIPNQSGTTRRLGDMPAPQRLVGVRPADPPSSVAAAPLPAPAAPRPTPPPPPAAATIEQRYRRILERLTSASESLKKEYEETLEMSWIHHDSALEGVVYTFQELRAAMDPSPAVVPDSSLQPVCEEIRRHRHAIAYVRDLGERRRVPLNVDVVKKLYVMLHPEEGDVKSVKYRKDIPQHRLYFHEYAPPDKIAYRVRQIMDWLNGPEAKKMKNPLRVAARVHYDLVRVFPFPNDSGKVSRLLMNIVLLRGGYPPAIIHSTERQRYYEALKGQMPVIVQLVNESILNALSSIEKRLDDEERQAS